jgi:hypothetical protein
MTDPQPLFSTFCHISQYGDTGYRVLPRMIAMSRPSLWSPSSVILNSGSSGISPKTFLRYVEDRGFSQTSRPEASSRCTTRARI